MLKFDVMTLFPEMFSAFTSESIIKRAIDNSLIEVITHNIRDYSQKKSKAVDDYVFGGSPGMLLDCNTVISCYRDIVKNNQAEDTDVIYLSPKGKVLNTEIAKELSSKSHLILLCGHYEGVDERAINIMNAKEISIGDYVLTGGELPAMVLIDCISRFVKGVLHDEESAYKDSFSNMLLEEEQYTRPREFEGLVVPEILLSGDHKKIEKWRLQRRIEITKERRPDLYKKYLEEKNEEV